MDEDWRRLMDGATTLAEAAQRFRERGEELVIRPGEESPMRLVEEED